MHGGNYGLRCNRYADFQPLYGLDAPLVVGAFYAGPDIDALQRGSCSILLIPGSKASLAG